MQFLTASGTRCKACHGLVCRVEEKKAVGLACLLKTMFEPKIWTGII